MTERTESPKADLPEPGPVTPQGRRRLLQGGLGAAPLLMTLVSRPALGRNQCFSPSGFVSMPTSQHGQPQFCMGRTPGFWKNSWDDKQAWKQWPPPYVAKGDNATKFTDYFAALPPMYVGSLTFLKALRAEDQGYSGPPHDLARHIVASLLNVAKGWVPVLTFDMVIGIWEQYVNTGGGRIGWYEPTAGVRWYHDDIVDYLLSTMTGGGY